MSIAIAVRRNLQDPAQSNISTVTCSKCLEVFAVTQDGGTEVNPELLNEARERLEDDHRAHLPHCDEFRVELL